MLVFSIIALRLLVLLLLRHDVAALVSCTGVPQQRERGTVPECDLATGRNLPA